VRYSFMVLFFLCLSISLSAQKNPQRCGTGTYWDYQVKHNPKLQDIKDSLNKQILQHNQSSKRNDDLIVIPVVVHVIYKINAQNISDAQIQSQIDVLNEDYRRMNADTTNTPQLFKAIAADSKIEFCLARRDPQGNYTSGITRTQTTKSSFNLQTDDAKYTSTGGHDIWDRNSYLNIWVVPDITDGFSSGILGYAQFPGGAAATDGVVIHYRNFGRIGNLSPSYALGRTVTHEVGHWLNLVHIWGDDGNGCWGSDMVHDTPNQADESYGCPNFPASSCSNTSDMFSNYMDYSDDDCMNIFTQGQSNRMRAAIDVSRASLKNSLGCVINSQEELAHSLQIQVLPNPSNGQSSLHFSEMFSGEIHIYNALGQLVDKLKCVQCKSKEIELKTKGLYFIHIQHKEFQKIEKIQVY
jgi:hypothetical protein